MNSNEREYREYLGRQLREVKLKKQVLWLRHKDAIRQESHLIWKLQQIKEQLSTSQIKHD